MTMILILYASWMTPETSLRQDLTIILLNCGTAVYWVTMELLQAAEALMMADALESLLDTDKELHIYPQRYARHFICKDKSNTVLGRW